MLNIHIPQFKSLLAEFYAKQIKSLTDMLLFIKTSTLSKQNAFILLATICNLSENAIYQAANN